VRRQEHFRSGREQYPGRDVFDTFHVLYGREVITDDAYRMGSDLKHMRLSQERRLAPGQRRADFPALIDALSAEGRTAVA
jgi:sugar phosphate isomerase/epimerase